MCRQQRQLSRRQQGQGRAQYSHLQGQLCGGLLLLLGSSPRCVLLLSSLCALQYSKEGLEQGSSRRMLRYSREGLWQHSSQHSSLLWEDLVQSLGAHFPCSARFHVDQAH